MCGLGTIVFFPCSEDRGGGKKAWPNWHGAGPRVHPPVARPNGRPKRAGCSSLSSISSDVRASRIRTPPSAAKEPGPCARAAAAAVTHVEVRGTVPIRPRRLGVNNVDNPSWGGTKVEEGSRRGSFLSACHGPCRSGTAFRWCCGRFWGRAVQARSRARSLDNCK